jgi:hypothetical protein
MADISVQTQTQATSPNRGRRRARGRGGKGGAKAAKGAVATDSATDSNAQTTTDVVKAGGDTTTAPDVTASQTEDDGQDLCWICAEPVKYYAISECNHRTCHVCALRLRALYKKLDCTFCKVSVNIYPSRVVIYSTHARNRNRQSSSLSPLTLPSRRILRMTSRSEMRSWQYRSRLGT